MQKLLLGLTKPEANIAAFLVTGVAGLLVDMGVYALASHGLPLVLARMLSITVAMTATWLMNRRYTFHPNAEKSLLREYMHYVLSSLLGAGVNYLCFLLLIYLFPSGLMEYLAIAISSAVAASVNFLLYKHLVFSASSPPQTRENK